MTQRLWLPAIAYLIAVALVGRVLEMMGFSAASMVAVQLGMQLWLGFQANDMKRWVLDRRGFTMRGVVCAESAMMAQQRVFAAAH